MREAVRWVGLAATVAAVAVGGTARADEKAAAADALFDEGMRLYKNGASPAACDKFSESFKLDPQNGTLLNLAKCHEEIGRTASAWSEFKEVAARAQRANQADREQLASEAVKRLEGKLRRVSLRVPQTAPADLEIRRNGEVVGQAQWTLAIPVDPGELKLSASAKGFRDWKRTTRLEPGPGTTEITVGPLAVASVASVASKPKGDGSPSQPTADAPAQGIGRVVGLVVAGVGVAALGTGAVLQFVALSQDSKKKDNETLATTAANSGDTSARDAYLTASKANSDAAKTDQILAIVSASAGIAMVVTGLVVFFTSPKKTTSAFQLVPSLSPTNVSLGATLRF